MWLFTKYGFFSVVCARQGTGAYSMPIDTERVQVRARVRGHLLALIEGFGASADISETRDTDYRFRILMPKSEWAKMAAELVNEIDYDNFKGQVARQRNAVGAGYEHALHEVWGVMNRLQQAQKD